MGHKHHDDVAAHDYGGDLEAGLGSVSTGETRVNGEKSSQEAMQPTTNGARRPSMFNRTFTQQIRHAGMDEEISFKDLSKQEKKQVMMMPLEYLMDTKFKDGKHGHLSSHYQD